MAVKTYEAFSVSHAAVLTGSSLVDLTTTAQLHDIYGVRDGSVSVDSGNFDNTGDDAILSTWFWINSATISVKSGYIPFNMVATLTGASIYSSGGVESLPMWEVTSPNQPPRPVLVRCPSRDSDGTSRYMDFVFFKCYFEPIKFEGPAYKNGLTVDFSARAVLSDSDEAGNTLTHAAIGRLVNRPAS
jgi:hypothetical protein